MSMRLTILGGAAAWRTPAKVVPRSCCVALEHRSYWTAAPTHLQELRRHADYLALDAIVISHCHADHILDLVPYRYGLVYGATRPRRPIPLWMPPGGMATLDALASAVGGDAESPGSSGQRPSMCANTRLPNDWNSAICASSSSVRCIRRPASRCALRMLRAHRCSTRPTPGTPRLGGTRA